ncbi:MAG TPA: SulP family inorganic anion transporter [Kiritimatiellia bacterium]|nr:SulP family inorganic anion transporter [Kiritimatiellia bacterium]HMP00112.1 SulP family inorganic anion transporter [Kiritimatiellia bacterium]HMP96573.1 SulP family inorganic anion transporter [Kiritimatiellia bacterium]
MITTRDLVSLKNLKGDVLGGLTTAIVSLPLALAFGVASGAGAQAGLYGAVLVGFWAAFFGGTRTLISEPTGPMTLMMTTVLIKIAAIHPEHALPLGFTVVVLAGLFQILFGALKLGRYITLMPYSVISGFMSGIGVLLVTLQIPSLLGHPTPPGGAPGVLAALPGLLDAVRWPEVILGSLALLVLFILPASWRKVVPPQLLVLVAGTLYAWAFFGTQSLRVIGDIPMGLPSFRWPVMSSDLIGMILVDALLLAMLGCIDTLLTAMIADSLTRSQHDSDRELIGQGIANTLSGLFGGLPGAGATMGTVVNIQSGAGTPRAALIRALTLLGVILVAAPLLSGVPMVILAAITIKVGFDILDWSFLRRAHRVSWTATLIMYGVLLITVMADIMVAVGIGVFIANIITIDRLSRLQASQIKTVDPTTDDSLQLSEEEKALLEKGRGNVVIFHLSGPMIFGVAKAIAREQAALQNAKVLIVDLRDVPMLATTVGLAIENVIRDAEAAGCLVIVAGAGPKICEQLSGLGLIGPEAHTLMADDRHAALRLAVHSLEQPVQEDYSVD